MAELEKPYHNLGEGFPGGNLAEAEMKERGVALFTISQRFFRLLGDMQESAGRNRTGTGHQPLW